MGTGRFVGRSSELGRLAGLVAGLVDRVGGVALVVGEQGIGKSALLRRVLPRVKLKAATGNPPLDRR